MNQFDMSMGVNPQMGIGPMPMGQQGQRPGQEGHQQVSSLPLPPTTYINLYSEENIRRGRAPKPPPPPPPQDTYSMFGAPFHADDAIIRPLESQGIRRLYPQNFDHRRELKKLNHSVLVNFLDLLDVLIKCPESSKRQEKIDDMTLLFIHMHHLINEFRPHQARETLRVMMEIQKRSTLDTIDRFQRHLEKSVEIIRVALTNLPDQQLDSTSTDSKLIASTESILAKSKKSGETAEKPIPSHDEMMCEIVDTL